MRIIKLAWVGIRTDNAEPTVAFFREVLGLRLELDQAGSWMLKLPDGSKVEVFGPDSPINRHFRTGPVVGFGRRRPARGRRVAVGRRGDPLRVRGR